jgi:dTDP-4-amino-4,6-dideoxygalactose transaminase
MDSLMTSVPFVDLLAPHHELEQELVDVFRQALRTGGFVGGPAVAEFERAFALYCQSREAVGVATGTDALLFAFLACGVKRGDVVVTVPHTFIATVEAIEQAGAIPEFVDVDPRTGNMDPAALGRYLEGCSQGADGRVVSRRSGKPVAAVVPVHLYGQPADMDAITELADRFHLDVIEDACQAHGADYRSPRLGGRRRAGSLGRAAAFSFYPSKNLGACGEGGAVTTSDPQIAARVRQLRDHGQSSKYVHEVAGYNGRLHALQAGILRVKLDHLDDWNARRRERAAQYTRLLQDVPGVTLLPEPEWSRGVYHLYVVRVAPRDALIEALKVAGISTGIHYPIPVHLQPACRALGYRQGDFPIAEQFAAEVVSLPMYPQISAEQVDRVVEAVRRADLQVRHGRG